MSRSKAQMKEARKLHKLSPGPLTRLAINGMPFRPPGMTRAYRNNRYTVMVYDDTLLTGGIKAIKAMIQRHDAHIIGNHWKELQNIKNEIFGKEVTAIEYYPAEENLIDDHNVYWLWILPVELLPIYEPKGKEKDE